MGKALRQAHGVALFLELLHGPGAGRLALGEEIRPGAPANLTGDEHVPSRAENGVLHGDEGFHRSPVGFDALVFDALICCLGAGDRHGGGASERLR